MSEQQIHMPSRSPDEPVESVDHAVLDTQRAHWTSTYTGNPLMFGTAPSASAEAAATRFRTEGVRDLLELGAGPGRDTLFFAAQGLHIHALDYAESALDALGAPATAAGVQANIQLVRHDVREPLPFADAQFDACYSHMLFNMALTTPELERLAREVWRVLRPGGWHVYTVRSNADPHYQQGIAHGDDMYEVGGFIVHFFSRALVERLATDAEYDLMDVAEFEEGPLPRRLLQVTLRKPNTSHK
jgi:SAM-dependent methyltransferase